MVWRTRVIQASPNAVAAVVAGVVFATSCVMGNARAERPRDAGGDLTAAQVRACLELWPEDEDALVFRTTRGPSTDFVGVLMLDPSQAGSRTATVGIAIFDDADLLDAYEERARADRDDEVVRIRNTVVAFHGPFTGALSRGERWVRRCLSEPPAPLAR